MNYQIWGDKLTIYFDNKCDAKQELEQVLEEKEIEWIVVDCEKVSEINNEMLELLLMCTSGTAEVVAVNASEMVGNMLQMCFVDVSLGFHYLPNSDEMILVFNTDIPYVEFANEKIFEFLEINDIQDDEERSLHNKIDTAVDECIEKSMDIQQLEIIVKVCENKITIDVINKSTKHSVQVVDYISWLGR